ncbi:MAG: formylmethanofuran dehydrogenase subunit B [Candidatus Bathyarchaeota archaeon]|nr:MAG: formylmethanofuran dehydrogenase subunit B [Candidatus Bathyarchaeota archaeon]
MPVIDNVTCPVCGTLCDDLSVTVKENAIIDVKNACAVSEAKFMSFSNPKHRNLRPLIRKNGKLIESTFEEAVEKSAQILVDASYPILYGWSCTSCEAIRVGLELAEEVGGITDNTSTVCHGPSILSIQNLGIPTCTLGQIRHRADLIIYWASDPYSAHPRHMERYTAFSDGRFQESEWEHFVTRLRGILGRRRLNRASELVLMKEASLPVFSGQKLPPKFETRKRKVIVVDVRKTHSAEFADFFLQVEPNKDFELFQALRLLVRDGELEVNQVAGVPVDLLEEVADALVGCDFGALFFGVGLTMSSGKLQNIDAAIALTQDLNLRTKFVIMPMRGHFNVAGANVVYTWQTGYPFALDFSQNYPRYNPGETSVVDILSHDKADAGLIVASDPVSNFPRSAVENLVKNPLIVIDPVISPTTMVADVVFPSAFVGIEVDGTAYRMDRVPLPMKKLVDPPSLCHSDEEILRRILHQVKRIKQQRRKL